ncbi:hypothetical protein MIND_00191600 [Mycena indigotica]|uniref:Uncharacterized protein n=1 Tax=Mycena indigotica TaxID=2126181 RepID=A0A8H6T6G0_9AGAR|nr:uncharacterized protein MIND_00191600 [Mycena indigotica]KAF7311811.1 hypothetical protein MIND_00191600 [Mycena indigotica]
MLCKNTADDPAYFRSVPNSSNRPHFFLRFKVNTIQRSEDITTLFHPLPNVPLPNPFLPTNSIDWDIFSRFSSPSNRPDSSLPPSPSPLTPLLEGGPSISFRRSLIDQHAQTKLQDKYADIACLAQYTTASNRTGIIATATMFFAMREIVEALGLDPEDADSTQHLGLCTEPELAPSAISTWEVLNEFGWRSHQTFTNKLRFYCQAQRISQSTWRADEPQNTMAYTLFTQIRSLWSANGPLHPDHRFSQRKQFRGHQNNFKLAAKVSENSLKKYASQILRCCT